MFSKFFIDRPIFASVLSIVIILVGGLGYLALPVAQYPEISPPTVQVSATYPGADAQTVAETVAMPIEQQVNGVENMMYMESRCTNDGAMNLTVTFKVGTDLNMAQVLVQNRVSLAEAKLPQEVTRNGLSTKKKSPSIILCVNLVSPNRTYDQLFMSNYATIQIKDVLSRLEGVGDVSLLGEREYSMRLWIDPEIATARGITANDIISAIKEQNVQVAAGQLGQEPVSTETPFQYTLRCRGRLIESDEFANIVIKTDAKGNVTRIRDIGRVDLGAKSYDVSSSFSGKKKDLEENYGMQLEHDLENTESVTIAVFQLPGSNAVETASNIRKAMQELKKSFPVDLDYVIAHDTTPFIEESISEVFKTLRDAIILVALVVLVFLQNWRSAIIPLVAVPVALVGTFAIMAMMGFSLNNLSLFGMVLAIGIVVDDAIVVVENVEQHLTAGLSPREATCLAMQEVSGPVIAVALVLCAVFIPTAFISGISGQFFQQFALTIAVSTVLSAFNSLTLSPALAAILLRPHGKGNDWLTRILNVLFGWFFRLFNRFFVATTTGYTWIVRQLLRTSAIVLLVYVGLLYVTGQIFTMIPVGFIPSQDKGYLLLNVQLPDSASLDRTQKVMDELDKIVRDTPSVRYTIGVEGMSLVSNLNASNLGSMFIILDEFDDRPERSANAVLRELTRKAAGIQEATIGIYGAPPVDGLGSAGGFKLQVEDRGNEGIESLQRTVDQMIETGQKTGKLIGLYTPFRSDTPQMVIDVDREKSKKMGVSLSDVFTSLQGYLGSMYVNDFTQFGRNFQVKIQSEPQSRMQPEDVSKIRVRNHRNEMVPLGALLTVVDAGGPSSISRYNMFTAAAINGDMIPGVSTGDAIAMMEKISERDMPSTMGMEWTELTYLQIIAGNTTVIIFALAVVLVFLVLAAQYESWSLPLAVILVVPMCILCSLIGVWIANLDMNIFTQIGFVVLVGLASKNAILIVEFAKMKREAGLSNQEATLEACRLRLRPIIMTSLAFILGVVPLVLANGAGAEMRVTLGVAVFSGMLGVTLFGIFLTPVFYYVIQKFSKQKSKPSRTD
ncbi:MAG: multidrug efflux RND transporter permease subunit [Thermoguttaceae bacterium]|nr:multidrug efflux RND transporter permease subunit [Thermoguttaceae bacterium]